MKKTILLAALLAATATPAAAQSFTGLRVEGHLGYDNVSISDVEDFDIDSDESGVLYGGGIGYDIALGGLILGVEANLDFTEAQYEATLGGDFAAIDFDRDLEFAARLGTQIGSNALLYGKVGYSNARLKAIVREDGVTTLEDAANGDGLRLGAGVEFNFGTSLFAKAEYRYSNYEAGISRNQLIGGLGFRF